MFVISPVSGRALLAAGGFVLAAFAAQPAAAVSLISGEGTNIQHTANDPCVLSGVNCPSQPADFDEDNVLELTVNGTSYTGGDASYNYNSPMGPPLADGDPEPDIVSTTWLVSDVLDVLMGERAFIVGIDVSQNQPDPGTPGTQDQQLDKFIVYVDADGQDGAGGNVEIGSFMDMDGFDPSSGLYGNIPVTNNPGNGFADWILATFMIPEGLEDDATITFYAELRNLNDGPDQFFISKASAIPVPASLPLMFTALLGLGFLKRRRSV